MMTSMKEIYKEFNEAKRHFKKAIELAKKSMIVGEIIPCKVADTQYSSDAISQKICQGRHFYVTFIASIRDRDFRSFFFPIFFIIRILDKKL